MERFLKSRYKIGEQISDNPYRVTYRGTFLANEKPIIIKIYKRAALNSSLIKTIRSQIKIFSGLHHHNIAGIIDGDYGWQGFYFVREYIEGHSLAEILKTTSPLDLEKASQIMLDVCEALATTHKMGIIHGAISPHNIIISNQKIVKLTDFVVENSIKEALPQKAIFLTEGASYLSPEEVGGCAAAPSSDIYAAGLVLYEMLTGRLPFEIPKEKISLQTALYKIQSTPVPPSSFNAAIPKNMDDIILKALERDPALRFATIEELALSLKNKSIFSNLPLPEFPPVSIESLSPPPPKEDQREHIRLPESHKSQTFYGRVLSWFFKVLALTIFAGIILAILMTMIKV